MCVSRRLLGTFPSGNAVCVSQRLLGTFPSGNVVCVFHRLLCTFPSRNVVCVFRRQLSGLTWMIHACLSAACAFDVSWSNVLYPKKSFLVLFWVCVWRSSCIMGSWLPTRFLEYVARCQLSFEKRRRKCSAWCLLMIILLVAILLMAITNYSISAYWWLFYWWLFY